MDVDTLVTAHQGQVWRLICRTIHDRAVHEDLFQEVFRAVIESQGRFQSRSKLSTWIHSVTLHTCYNHLRRQRPEISLEAWLDAGGDNPPGLTVTDRCVTHRVEEGEFHRDLELALDRLPPKQRLPIHLYYLEGMTYAQIAEVVNLPLGTVKTNIFRGLRAMRDTLKEGGHAYL